MQHPRNMHLMHAHTRLEGIRRLPLALTSIQRARDATCGVHPSTRQQAKQKRTFLLPSNNGQSLGVAQETIRLRACLLPVGGMGRLPLALFPITRTNTQVAGGFPDNKQAAGRNNQLKDRWGGCHRRCSPSSNQTIGCWGLPRQQTGCGPEQSTTKTWGGCHWRCSPTST